MRAATIGGCRLTGIAGAGGFAVTYAGQHPDAGPVAIKVLSDNWVQDADVANRFEAECEKLADAGDLIGAERPAVPRYHGHGVDRGAPYLVTELCAGGSLAQRTGALANADPEERLGPAAWVVAQSAAALRVVHERLAVIHRDLSPGNLLFRRHEVDGSEEIVIGDFGLMKEAALQSNFSRVLGTATYAAPEVRNRGVCDARSDVYSLGVIAWELLSGRRAEIDQPLERLDTLSPRIPAEVAEAVAAMTAPDRSDRPDLARVAEVFGPRATRAPDPPAVVVTPLPPDRGRARRLATVAAAVLILAGGGALAASLRSGDDPYVVYQPDEKGFQVALDATWTDIDERPDDPRFALSALNQERGLVLLAGAVGAADAASALEVAATTLTGDEILSSEVIDENRTRLHYRSGGRDSIIWFLTQRCGALSVTFGGTGTFDDDTVAYVDELGRRLAVVSDLTLPDRDPAEVPDGFQRLERNGASLVVPDDFFAADDASGRCLQVIDNGHQGPGQRAASVFFYPGATAEGQEQIRASTWEAARWEVVDTAPTADGRVRRLIRSEAEELEALYTYLEVDGGLYEVEVFESGGAWWTADDLAEAEAIAASLELTA